MMCFSDESYSWKESHCSAEMHTSVFSSIAFPTYPVITLSQRIVWAFSKKGKMSSSYSDTQFEGKSDLRPETIWGDSGHLFYSKKIFIET
jgi:hypothetical protein